MANIMKVDKKFTPCAVDDGDELYPNGIFVFNVTKMLKYIQVNSVNVFPEEVAVSDFPEKLTSIDESYLESVDIAQPVIVAEISPGRYNVIDGNHRMEKARRSGVMTIPAYRLNPEQHMKFLIDQKGYVAYIKYWNSKVKAAGASRR